MMQKAEFSISLLWFMKQSKRFAGLLGSILIFAAIVRELDYIYVEDTESQERIMWHNFYEDKGKIDNIYLGSSKVYCDVSPSKLDSMNGQYNFDLSSSAQRLNGSYYLLKEADKNNTLSHVYLELYYRCNVKSGLNSDSDPINDSYYWNWTNADYMKNSFNRMLYRLSIAGAEKYTDIFLPFTRYRADLDNWEILESRMEGKNTPSYLNYQLYDPRGDGTYREYMKQGYFYSNTSVSQIRTLNEQTRILNENPMGEISKKYLIKILEYCKKHNLPLTIFVAPINRLELEGVGNYDNYVTQVRNILKKYDVPYYDFNLAKEQYLSVYNKKYWQDFAHMNNAGAETFTQFLGETLLRSEEDNQKYFYVSYADKRKNEAPEIYGLYYFSTSNSDDEDALRRFYIASNRDSGIEYKVVFTDSEGIKQVIQDYSENKELILGQNEQGGVLRITARSKDGSAAPEPIEINFSKSED